MTFRILLLTLSAYAVGGCASIDRVPASDFKPTSERSFEFVAAGSALDYPEDSPAAEKVRMDWLRTWLDDNGMCPDGYKITQRKPVKVGAFGARIYYLGECT